MKKIISVIIATIAVCTANCYAQSNLTSYHSGGAYNDMYVKVSTPEEDGSFNYYIEVNNLMGDYIDNIMIVIPDSGVDIIKSALAKVHKSYDKQAKKAARKGLMTEEKIIKVKFPEQNIIFERNKQFIYEISAITSYFEVRDGQCILVLYGTPSDEHNKEYAGYSVEFASAADFDSFLRCFDKTLAEEHFAELKKTEALFN